MAALQPPAYHPNTQGQTLPSTVQRAIRNPMMAMYRHCRIAPRGKMAPGMYVYRSSASACVHSHAAIYLLVVSINLNVT